MSVPQLRYSREEVARLGDAIYEREVRPRIESGDVARYVAIDVETHAYVIADDLLSASDRLQEQYPNAEIWLVRVGHRALHRIGGHGRLGRFAVVPHLLSLSTDPAAVEGRLVG